MVDIVTTVDDMGFISSSFFMLFYFEINVLKE